MARSGRKDWCDWAWANNGAGGMAKSASGSGVSVEDHGHAPDYDQDWDCHDYGRIGRLFLRSVGGGKLCMTPTNERASGA